MRATKRLHSLGLIARISHGGYSGRTRYETNFGLFDDFVRDWDEKKKTRRSGQAVADVRRQRSPGCDVARREDATQTHISNSDNKTQTEPSSDCQVKSPVSDERDMGAKCSSRAFDEMEVSAKCVNKRRGRQRQDVAAQVAYQRLMAELKKRSESWEQYDLALRSLSDDMIDAAVKAEMHRKGSGIKLITCPPEG